MKGLEGVASCKMKLLFLATLVGVGLAQTCKVASTDPDYTANYVLVVMGCLLTILTLASAWGFKKLGWLQEPEVGAAEAQGVALMAPDELSVDIDDGPICGWCCSIYTLSVAVITMGLMGFVLGSLVNIAFTECKHQIPFDCEDSEQCVANLYPGTTTTAEVTQGTVNIDHEEPTGLTFSPSDGACVAINRGNSVHAGKCGAKHDVEVDGKDDDEGKKVWKHVAKNDDETKCLNVSLDTQNRLGDRICTWAWDVTVKSVSKGSQADIKGVEAGWRLTGGQNSDGTPMTFGAGCTANSANTVCSNKCHGKLKADTAACNQHYKTTHTCTNGVKSSDGKTECQTDVKCAWTEVANCKGKCGSDNKKACEAANHYASNTDKIDEAGYKCVAGPLDEAGKCGGKITRKEVLEDHGPWKGCTTNICVRKAGKTDAGCKTNNGETKAGEAACIAAADCEMQYGDNVDTKSFWRTANAPQHGSRPIEQCHFQADVCLWKQQTGDEIADALQTNHSDSFIECMGTGQTKESDGHDKCNGHMSERECTTEYKCKPGGKPTSEWNYACFLTSDNPETCALANSADAIKTKTAKTKANCTAAGEKWELNGATVCDKLTWRQGDQYCTLGDYSVDIGSCVAIAGKILESGNCSDFGVDKHHECGEAKDKDANPACEWESINCQPDFDWTWKDDSADNNIKIEANVRNAYAESGNPACSWKQKDYSLAFAYVEEDSTVADKEAICGSLLRSDCIDSHSWRFGSFFNAGTCTGENGAEIKNSNKTSCEAYGYTWAWNVSTEARHAWLATGSCVAVELAEDVSFDGECGNITDHKYCDGTGAEEGDGTSSPKSSDNENACKWESPKGAHIHHNPMDNSGYGNTVDRTYCKWVVPAKAETSRRRLAEEEEEKSVCVSDDNIASTPDHHGDHGRMGRMCNAKSGCQYKARAAASNWCADSQRDWTNLIYLPGKLWVNSLKLFVGPLVVFMFLLMPFRVDNYARKGYRTLILLTVTSFFAALEGLMWVNIIRPGDGMGLMTKAQQAQHDADCAKTSDDVKVLSKAASGVKDMGKLGPLSSILGIFEKAIVKDILGAIQGINILALICFFCGLGICIKKQGRNDTEKKWQNATVNCSKGILKALLQMIVWVIYFTPLGMLSLVTYQLARMDNATYVKVLGGIGKYVVCQMVGQLVHMFVFYPIFQWLMVMHAEGYKSPLIGWKYFAKVFQAPLTAFATSSSAATMPVTLAMVKTRGGVSRQSADLVVPLGAAINMDGTGLGFPVMVIFTAQAYGKDLMFGDQLIVAILAVVCSIGTAPIPNAGIVYLTMLMAATGDPLLSSEEVVGVALTLIIIMDWFVDRMETAQNVWSDCNIARIIDIWENDANKPPKCFRCVPGCSNTANEAKWDQGEFFDAEKAEPKDPEKQTGDIEESDTFKAAHASEGLVTGQKDSTDAEVLQTP